MNDFTLEELEYIANCVYVYDDLRDGSGHYILLKKIHSVIDNYCEHERTKEVPSNSVIICTKCYKVVEE